MRRSAKWFGFVVAASLIVGACGGDDSSTTGNSITENSTADTSTSDTTADDGDRDRNVKVGGWGADGSGIASVKVAESISTTIRTRVFRRARTELVNDKKVRNEQDVFVVTAVQRTVDGADGTFFKVQGFNTAGDDPKNYPMANFGTDGVVTVKVPPKSPTWAPMPESWTMVSRDILAAYYFNWEDEPGDNGFIEYYDLRSGGLMTSMGDAGRTVFTTNFPIGSINDLGFRGFDENGSPRMLVSGIRYDEEGMQHAVVMGITPDGKPDPLVGSDGSGLIDVSASVSVPDNFTLDRVRLADPGLDDGASGIGVVMMLDGVTADDAKDRNWERALQFVRLGRNTATGTVAMAEQGSFEYVWMPYQSHIDVRSAIVTAGGGLAAHVTSTAVGDGYWGGTRSDTIVTASSEFGSYRELRMPRWVGDGRTSEPNLPIKDPSSTGLPFVAGSFFDPASGAYQSRVCFKLDACGLSSSTASIELTPGSELAERWPGVSSINVDDGEVRVMISNFSSNDYSSLYTLASFDAAGAPQGSVTPSFDSEFDTILFSEVERNGEFETLVEKEIARPAPLGSQRVFALHSTSSQLLMRIQAIGGNATDVALRPPLGISSWLDDNRFVKPMSDRHVSMATEVDNGINRVRRIYKVDAENGSIDTTFGTNGYAETVVPQDDETACGVRKLALTSAGSVAQIEAALEWSTDTDFGGCARMSGKYRWSVVDAAGQAVGKAWATADASVIPGAWDESNAIDPRGSLFVAKGYETTDDEDNYESGIWIGKFTQDGNLDPMFGTKGLLKIENVWGSALATDAEGRLYVATLDGTMLFVRRYTTAGVLDAAVDAPAPTEDVAKKSGNAEADARNQARTRIIEEAKAPTTDRVAAQPDSGLTITTDKPVVTSVTAVEDRSLTVAWALSASVGNVFVTATANPGGRSCTSDIGNCVIRGLDPSEIYTITLAKKGEEPQPATVATATKPVVSLKIGRVASPTTFVRPASKGKATWKVRGGCKLNETNTRLTAPKSPGTCQLSVTTAKSGSTPKTTKSVTIVVKK